MLRVLHHKEPAAAADGALLSTPGLCCRAQQGTRAGGATGQMR